MTNAGKAKEKRGREPRGQAPGKTFKSIKTEKVGKGLSCAKAEMGKLVIVG